MEIRDGDYLRQSAFGDFLQAIESTMTGYDDNQWKSICEKTAARQSRDELLKPEDRQLFSRIDDFFENAASVVFSYAIAHPLHDQAENPIAETHRIVTAKKLAYLLCPQQARLRLVDPEFSGDVNAPLSISNLKRYKALLPDLPVILAVENAKESAVVALDLAEKSGTLMAYDEANTFDTSGKSLNPPESFWRAVKMEHLTSVHIKQQTAGGIASVIGEGYVDFRAILKRLKTAGYAGDLLIENAPTGDPLQDAVRSREYLASINEKN